MGRFLSVGGLAFLVLGLVASSANADEGQGLANKVEKLERELQVIRTSMLEKEIDSYLSESEVHAGAQADGQSGWTLHANFTSVLQATVGLSTSLVASSDTGDIHAASGDVDLQFDFPVTDNLSLFIDLTANTNSNFPTTSSSLSGSSSSGSLRSTLAGLTDGIGVDGTNPIYPGSITVEEAGIYHKWMLGNTLLHWELGKLDPRKRFLQNAFADDENTQFIHNSFDDTAAFLWGTSNSGTSSLAGTPSSSSGSGTIGWHMWVNLGDNDNITVNWGWFNAPGPFFDKGQFYIQFHWKGEVSGREMNIRVAALINNRFRDATGDGDESGAVSWDWWATDTIGVFVRIGGRGGDVNPVEFDASLGAVFHGLISSRPDDRVGVAFGFITLDDSLFPGVAEDTEFTIEIYYAYMAEDGKLQITPHLIFVSEPGGGDALFGDDTLFILGLRIHVPF